MNSEAYAEPDERVTPLSPWPDPADGFALRVYPLAETPIAEGRFGRILDPGVVARVLDAGAEGVMVPHVDTVAKARAAAAAARFPPLGNRGVGSTSRAGRWGALPREEYLRFGQDEVVVIAQIESAAGVANSGAIAAVEGIDALLVGTADLSVSEQRAEDDPALIELVVRQSEAAGIPVGNAGGASAEAVRSAIDAGFGFTLLSNDAGLLSGAARSAVEAAVTAASGAGCAGGGGPHA